MSALTDRELLDLAAKAAGIAPYRYGFYCEVDGTTQEWIPLTDDGDALRLAVKLGLYLEIDRPNGRASAMPEQEDMPFSREQYGGRHGNDACAALRRAIVRAAAAIGEAM